MLKTFKFVCKKHGTTDFSRIKSKGKVIKRCKKCHAERIKNDRREKRQRLIRAAGGKCQLCGYDKCPQALEFHHKDPRKKDFTISDGIARSLKKSLAEINKCVLLCANCHREVESKLVKLKKSNLIN